MGGRGEVRGPGSGVGERRGRGSDVCNLNLGRVYEC